VDTGLALNGVLSQWAPRFMKEAEVAALKIRKKKHIKTSKKKKKKKKKKGPTKNKIPKKSMMNALFV
jgi:hypothetical protein